MIHNKCVKNCNLSIPELNRNGICFHCKCCTFTHPVMTELNKSKSNNLTGWLHDKLHNKLLFKIFSNFWAGKFAFPKQIKILKRLTKNISTASHWILSTNSSRAKWHTYLWLSLAKYIFTCTTLFSIFKVNKRWLQTLVKKMNDCKLLLERKIGTRNLFSNTAELILITYVVIGCPLGAIILCWFVPETVGIISCGDIIT